jgi:hypothetical protein
MLTALKRALALVALIACIVPATGCFEEKDSLTVHGDGSGKMHVRRKLGAQLTSMIASNGDAKAGIDDMLWKEMAAWDGVAAWTDCKSAVEEGCAVLEATGWFDDVSKVTRTEDKKTQRLAWKKNADGGYTLTWGGGEAQDWMKQLAMPADQWQQSQQMMSMFDGLKIEHEIVLPGPCTACEGAECKGRTASSVLTAADVKAAYASLGEYRARVAKGEITNEKANEELKTKFGKLSFDLSVTCGAPTDGDEIAQAKKDAEKAKADFAASDTPKKIAAAKQAAGGKK